MSLAVGRRHRLRLALYFRFSSLPAIHNQAADLSTYGVNGPLIHEARVMVPHLLGLYIPKILRDFEAQ